ncbi:hypothetical protein EDC04DRAFT_343260 [Pisolithus marmoratus]|nr:hypothetical protein EDC04DRAFT_343260 [Pisolithus marmoratus]
MESQLCNELGETSVSTAQGNGLPAHSSNASFDPRCTLLLLERCEGLVQRPYGTRRKIHNEIKLISQTLSVGLLDRVRSSFLEEPEDKERTGQGARTDYDPVGVRSTIRGIVSLEKKLQATHDEDEQCALEEDITGKILWFYWDGIRSEMDQILPKVVDRIWNDADEDYRAGLRQIAEIIKRAPHEIPDDDTIHLRRVMYDAGTGVSRHRLWLDARAAEQAELSRILSGKPIPATHETASNTNTEAPSTLIIRQTLGNSTGTLRLLLTTFKICTRIAMLMGMM